jgi:Arc/MetJ-type ribon-helix-helix transcriptional regulator
MKVISLRLSDSEHAALEVCIQKRYGRNQSEVIRKALREVNQRLGIKPQDALAEKQKREQRNRLRLRDGRL